MLITNFFMHGFTTALYPNPHHTYTPTFHLSVIGPVPLLLQHNFIFIPSSCLPPGDLYLPASLMTHSLPVASSLLLLLLLLLTSLGNLLPAVVPVLLGDSQAGRCQPLFGRELPDVPEFDGLVLRVADQVACITLAQSWHRWPNLK